MESSFFNRSLPRPPPQEFEKHFCLIREIIEKEFQVRVIKRELDPRITGTFDGKEIAIRDDLPVELQLFILLHLFGHTVQWNTSRECRRIGLIELDSFSKKETIKVVRVYEHKASQYGLGLLHQAQIFSLDQWLASWSATDWQYFLQVCLTGKNDTFDLSAHQRYWVDGANPITPQTVPLFTPRLWEQKHAF